MAKKQGTCDVCGREFVYEHLQGRPRATCSPQCKSARKQKPPRPPIPCGACGTAFVPSTRARYCSKKCQREPSRQRWLAKCRQVVKSLTCQHCDSAFETTHKRRFCTKTCRLLAYRTVRECEMCQGPVVVAKSNTVTRFCGRRCSAQFTGAQRRDPSAPPRGKGHHARAQQYGCSYEVIDRAAVFSRDGWMCGLCQEPVNPATQWPHPLSASLDHVVPLARGGDHLYSNVQLAHLTCNISKGARHGSTEEATR